MANTLGSKDHFIHFMFQLHAVQERLLYIYYVAIALHF